MTANRQPLTSRIGLEVSFWLCEEDRVSASNPDVLDSHAFARVTEKAGLQREGVLRRRMVLPGFGDAPRDSVVYARTR